MLWHIFCFWIEYSISEHFINQEVVVYFINLKFLFDALNVINITKLIVNI